MIVVVIALIALVCGVQAIGDRLARRLNHRL
jgi:ABC-type methionine transport system permease subunit